MKNSLLPHFFLIAFLLLCLTAPASAQQEGKIVPLPPSTTPKAPPKARVQVRSQARAKETASTGSLTVIAEPGAKVSLDLAGSQRQSSDREGEIPASQTHFIFNDLKTGRYRVSAELEGYEYADNQGQDGAQVINIIAGQPRVVAFKLRPITYHVPIKSNVLTGEVRYTTTGETYCIAEINNGQALLPELRAGKYQIEIRTSEVGYQPLKASIEVGGEKTGFEATLSYNVSKVPFGPNIEASSWELPRGWRISSGKIFARGKGVAFPSLKTARHYANFVLESTVRVTRGDAVSFVLRARDSTNYYLIQIARGQESALRGFVVNGEVKTLLGNPVPFTDPSLLNDFFTVKICVIGHTIRIAIEAADGRIAGIMALQDGNQNFNVGAAGIAITALEEVEVGRFYVNNWESKTCPPDNR